MGLGPTALESGRALGTRARGDATAMVSNAVEIDIEARHLLFRSANRGPPYVLTLRAFTGMLDWLAVELAVSMRLLMARLRVDQNPCVPRPTPLQAMQHGRDQGICFSPAHTSGRRLHIWSKVRCYLLHIRPCPHALIPQLSRYARQPHFTPSFRRQLKVRGLHERFGGRGHMHKAVLHIRSQLFQCLQANMHHLS